MLDWIVMASDADALRRLLDGSVLFLTLGPGLMMCFSGLLGSLHYWARTSAGTERGQPVQELVEGINVGLVVGFVTGVPFAAVVALARISGLIGE